MNNNEQIDLNKRQKKIAKYLTYITKYFDNIILKKVLIFNVYKFYFSFVFFDINVSTHLNE